MSKKIDNDSIASPAAEPVKDDAMSATLAEQAVEGGEALTPQTFDMAAWLSGVQPIRRAVTVYAREDLRALVDELAELEMVTPEGERAAIVAEATELQEQIRASAATFVIEGKTATWVKAFQKTLEDQGIKDPEERMLRQIVEQVVEPGITYEDLVSIGATREDIVTKLLTKMMDANTRPGALNPRFLRGASD